MTTKQIARLIPTMSALALAGENIKLAKKKKTTKDILETGMKNIVGVNMLKIQAGFIESI